MNKRVYGVLGISSIMANWNADFSGYPKTTTDGTTFGSDKALKYPIKKLWQNDGHKILYIKSYRMNEEKGVTSIIPRTLGERYEQIFDVTSLKDTKDTSEVLKNLFDATDVKNFGATFAEAGNNIAITGAVQIGQGYNKYDATEPQEQQILSPFRDPKAKEKSKAKDNEEGEEAKSSTLGTKIMSDEAHYFYPFAINPLTYKEYIDLGVTTGYTEEDYQDFKHASLVAATSFATNAKAGCDNEFALYVETDPNLYLPNLSEYIEFEKGDKKNVIRIICDDLLNDLADKIQSIEVYYNPYNTVIESKIEGAKHFNIFTQKEV